jgi:hypothetical protein
MIKYELQFRQKVALAAATVLAITLFLVGYGLDGSWNAFLLGVAGSIAGAILIALCYSWLKADADPYITLDGIENLKRSGLLAINLDVSEEDHKAVCDRLRKAKSIYFTAHTGYNAVCVLYRRALADAVQNGAKLRVVVSDPDGALLSCKPLTDLLCPSISQQKDLENVIDVCRVLHSTAKRAAKSKEPQVMVRLYPGVPTLNALLVDDWLRITQYLPLLDAADAPIMEFCRTPGGELFRLYEQVFEKQWAKSRELNLKQPTCKADTLSTSPAVGTS